MIPAVWQGKRYYSLHAYLKKLDMGRIKKRSIDAGFTCPNRDGTLDTRGCIFCSAGGSGDFAIKVAEGSKIAGDFGRGAADGFANASRLEETAPYIAYFQAYTCTYAPIERLSMLYRGALEAPYSVGISIATRPDCLPEEVIGLLALLKKEYPDKFIWIELGLQTIHQQTADYIRRGYALSCFRDAVDRLHAIGIPVIVHTILGLPGENRAMMLETIDYVSALPVFGIKLQLLHVLSGTDLAADYERGLFSVLSMENYLDILIDSIEHLAPHIVIHRVTGDGPKELLIAPKWSAHKKKVLNELHHQMKLRDSYQGKYWKGNSAYVPGTTSDTL